MSSGTRILLEIRVLDRRSKIMISIYYLYFMKINYIWFYLIFINLIFIKSSLYQKILFKYYRLRQSKKAKRQSKKASPQFHWIFLNEFFLILCENDNQKKQIQCPQNRFENMNILGKIKPILKYNYIL